MLPAPAAPAGREAVEGAKGRPSTASPGLPEPAPTGGAAAPPRASPSRSPGSLGTWLSPPSWAQAPGGQRWSYPGTVGPGGPDCLKRGESGCWCSPAVWRHANAKICLKDLYFFFPSFLMKAVTAFTGNEGTQAERDGGRKSGSVCHSWLLAGSFQTHQKSSKSRSATPKKSQKAGGGCPVYRQEDDRAIRPRLPSRLVSELEIKLHCCGWERE